MPGFGHALELMLAAILDPQTGPGNEVLDRARDQDFARTRERPAGIWRARRDSNPRPCGPKPHALVR